MTMPNNPDAPVPNAPLVRFGKRADGSMWLSIGQPEAGPNMQADWEFGEFYAQIFAEAVEAVHAKR